MPDLASLVAFSLTALALVVAPGPDTMLILRYGLTSGRRAALAAVAGVQVGLVVHTLLAVAGISALIAASPTLFRGLAIAGVAYLGWLGIGGLRGTAAFAVHGARPPVTARAAWRDAVLTNVLNPKVILLFVALYPNFIKPDRGDVASQLLSLSAVLIVINVIWQTPLAWAANRVRGWLGSPHVQVLVSRLTGAVLLAFAVLILWQHAA
jgi:threonine/homoserine/homoserine lactone efflux protein